ncbi:MAG TPA: DUF4340 domain-containing protein [Rhizomicrobium sp.]
MSDPRRRNLAILAGLAVLLAIWAVAALWQQSAELGAKYNPTPMFPDLPHQANSVARVHVASKTGGFDVVMKPGKGWVVTSRNDFPASFAEVNRTVVGLATLETLEPKTARADWLHYLGLDAPPKGAGVLVTLADAQGHTLASVITGKTLDIGDQSGISGLFVRKADSTQSWLAKSVFQPKTDPTEWYDKNLVDIDRNRIAETDVTPADSPAYSVKRDKPKDADFKLVNPPAGRELSYPGAADGVGAAIVGLTFDDAKPAKGMDFSKAWKLVTQTFDGLTITIQAMQQGQDYWTTVSAEAAPGKPNAAREATAINAKTSGWAYKLPPYKGQQLMTKLDSLLKPPPAAPAPPTKPAPKK